MKVLYGIQMNGNGHITRSLEVIRTLKDLGVKVDILISGKNSEIEIPYEIKFKFRGLSIYYSKNGYVNWFKTIKNLNIFRLIYDIKKVDVKDYDLIISDFEPITAWSSKINKIKSLSISNQSSLLNKENKRNSYFSKLFIKYFAPCKENISLSYKNNNGNYLPIVDKKFLISNPKKKNNIVIYLPSLSIIKIVKVVRHFKFTNWTIYTNEVEKDISYGFIKIKKINRNNFQNDLINCYGVITASGFSTTTEALILNKKLWSIPLKGQYEQLCNSDFLNSMGIYTSDFSKKNLENWLINYKTIDYKYESPINLIIDKIFNLKKLNKS